MMIRQNSNLGALPLIIGGGVAAAAAGGWIWNKATGLWEMATLPGSVFGPDVPALKPPPAPSAAGAAGATWDQRAQTAADEANRAAWAATVFDGYYAAAPAPSASSFTAPGGGDGVPAYVWALGAAAVALLMVRR